MLPQWQPVARGHLTNIAAGNLVAFSKSSLSFFSFFNFMVSSPLLMGYVSSWVVLMVEFKHIRCRISQYFIKMGPFHLYPLR